MFATPLSSLMSNRFEIGILSVDDRGADKATVAKERNAIEIVSIVVKKCGVQKLLLFDRGRKGRFKIASF
jgi:hypothetical protein